MPAQFPFEAYLNRTELPWEVKRESTALLVIDMQRIFVDEDAFLYVPQAREQIPNIKDMIGCCRERNIPVIYTQWAVNNPRQVPQLYQQFPALRSIDLKSSSDALQISRELEPLPNDVIIKKPLLSAFVQMGLDDYLKEHGIRTLLITGTVTNVCVNSTVDYAFHLGYHNIVLSDCCSPFDPEMGKYFLRNMGYCLGFVTDSEEVKRILG